MKKALTIGVTHLLCMLLSLALGGAFLLIYFGLYGMVLLSAPYFRPTRRLMELIFGQDLSLLERPLRSTSPLRVLYSGLLVIFRIACVVFGILILVRNGFLGQNLIWIYANR